MMAVRVRSTPEEVRLIVRGEGHHGRNWVRVLRFVRDNMGELPNDVQMIYNGNENIAKRRLRSLFDTEMERYVLYHFLDCKPKLAKKAYIDMKITFIKEEIPRVQKFLQLCLL